MRASRNIHGGSYDASSNNPIRILDFNLRTDMLRLAVDGLDAMPSQLNSMSIAAGQTLRSTIDLASNLGAGANAPTLTQIIGNGSSYLVLDRSSLPEFSAGSDMVIELVGISSPLPWFCFQFDQVLAGSGRTWPDTSLPGDL